MIPTNVTLEAGTNVRSQAITPAKSGCNSGWGRETYSNAIMKIYYWEVDVASFCFNGSKVTSMTTPTVKPYVYGGAAAAWSYEGLVDKTSYGVGTSQAVAYAEGHFKYAPPPKLWTLFNGWPWVRLYLHADGKVTMSGSPS